MRQNKIQNPFHHHLHILLEAVAVFLSAMTWFQPKCLSCLKMPSRRLVYSCRQRHRPRHSRDQVRGRRRLYRPNRYVERSSSHNVPCDINVESTLRFCHRNRSSRPWAAISSIRQPASSGCRSTSFQALASLANTTTVMIAESTSESVDRILIVT